MFAQLIQPEELREDNHLEASRTILRVVHDLADRSSTRLMETMAHSLDAQKETNQRLGNLEDGIQTLTSDIDKGFDRLSTEFKSEIGRLDNRIKSEVGRLDNRMDQTNQRLDQTNQRLDQTNQELKEVKAEVKELKEDVREMKGDIKGIKVVLKEIKTDFLTEQRETNALLKQLIAKK